MSMLALYSYIHGIMLFIVFVGVFHVHPKYRLPDAKRVYCLMINLMVPIILSQRQDWLAWNWLVCSVLPGITIVLTGSQIYAVMSAVLQLVYFAVFYQQGIKEFLDQTFSINLVQLFLLISTVKIIADTGIMIAMDSKTKNVVAQSEHLKIQEKLKLKTRTLTFSHELRNPINSMLGHVQLALLEKLPANLQDYLQTAKFCGDLLVHTLNNILDREKIEVDNLDINPSPIKIYESIEKTWEFLSEFIKSKKLYGHFKIHKNVPKTIHIDTTRLSQILFNLVKNAVDFTDKGVVTVNIDWISDVKQVNENCFPSDPFNPDDEGVFEKDKRITWMNKGSTYSATTDSSIIDLKVKNFLENDSNMVKFHTEHEGKTRKCSIENAFNSSQQKEFQEGYGVLRIEVSDTGCGMKPNDVEKLFANKEMETLNINSLKPASKGYNLFVTKEVCKKMEGEIKCFSKVGTGSAFVVCVPVACVYEVEKVKRKQSISEVVKEVANKHENLKALIVDDFDLNLTVLANLLQKMGVKEIIRAQNGLEATQKYLKAIKDGAPFNIVTMDLEMPIMEGKTASKQIRQLEKEFELEPSLLMIVSGNCVQDEIAECLDQEKEIRADHFVKKPAKMEDLSNALNLYKKKISSPV